MKGCLTHHAPIGLGDGREHYKRLITFTLDKQICLIILWLRWIKYFLKDGSNYKQLITFTDLLISNFFRRKCENWIAKFQNEINGLRGWKNSTRCPVVELDRM